MGLSHFFIDRPIFSVVISIFTLLVGAVAYFALPVAQYPDVAPPTVVVNATYPGASASVIADTVAAPLEQEINGVEGMLYLASQSTSDGRMSLTITFEIGTNLEDAQVLVQNRVAAAEPRLPEEVRRLGVTTQKSTPDILMVVHLRSPDETFDQLYISNYALLQVRDELARIDGVGSVTIFGARDYSMRVWLDPDRIASLNLTAGDVIQALRAENVQVAGGALGRPPTQTVSAFQKQLTLQGRLEDVAQFENIVVKTGDDGRFTRLKDVARVELGAVDYSSNSYLSNQPAVALAMSQRPGSNALATANEIKATMAELSGSFPAGLTYEIVYNPTEFIEQSIDELYRTIAEAVLLVILVMIVFLQSLRASLIPIIAIPVSLIGTFAAMAAFGFSINNLTLFGLVLAVGTVVDDAIVVVENIERNLRAGMSRREAARKTMSEVGGALVATSMVLWAVFIPVAFIEGISGQFYLQFAVTITAATVFSLINSLTLSPALARLLMTPGTEAPKSSLKPLQSFFDRFNAFFDDLQNRYSRGTAFLTKRAGMMAAIYAALIGTTAVLFSIVPGGFIPQQDKGYFIVAIQLPPGASLSRTDEVVRRVGEIAAATPGVANAVQFAGFSGATRSNASNAGAVFTPLEPFSERMPKGLTGDRIQADLRQRLSVIQDGFVGVFSPPPVNGIGTTGGVSMRVQDRNGRGPRALEQATFGVINAANQNPAFAGIFPTFQANTPELFVDVNRTRAQILDVPVANIFEALEVYVGSTYVNDFNLFGRTYRVTAQADSQFREDISDIARLRTRSSTGAMVPLGSVVEFSEVSGPDRVLRYNLFPAAEVQGSTVQGVASGDAIATLEQIADQTLPPGFTYAWTDLSFQQKQEGGTIIYVFTLAVIFVFLVLAAQYESWSLPLAIILIVPMCLLSAILGVIARGFDNNILTQIGFVVLIGLAAKNAILIVEFARQLQAEGKNRFEAAVEAARLRFRPILMTSFSFILGVVPLVVASGAAAELRQALGTAVFFGMIGVTFFGLIFTPVFYVLIMGLVERIEANRPQDPEAQPAE